MAPYHCKKHKCCICNHNWIRLQALRDDPWKVTPPVSKRRSMLERQKTWILSFGQQGLPKLVAKKTKKKKNTVNTESSPKFLLEQTVGCLAG